MKSPAFILFVAAFAALAGWLAFASLGFAPHADQAAASSSPVPSQAVSRHKSPDSQRASPLHAESASSASAPPVSWMRKITALQAKENTLGALEAHRTHPLQALVERLSLMEVPRALDAVRKLQAARPTPAGDDLQIRLAWKWATVQPLALAKWAEGSQGPVRGALFNVAATSLARQDLDGAESWAGQLPDANDREAALTGIASEVAYTAPAKAIDIALKLKNADARDDLIERAAGAWATEEPEDALEWVQKLPESELKTKALASAAISMADSDPAAAARLAATSLPPGPRQEATVLAIVQRWTIRDPAAAAQWIGQFPAMPLRDAATQMIKDTVFRINRPNSGPLPGSM